MALLWQKGNKDEKVAVAKKAPAKIEKKAPKKAETKAVAKVAPSKTAKGEVVFPKSSVLNKPRITEKAGVLAEKNIYTFDVTLTANVQQITQAIKEAYKVTPVKVSTVTTPGKSVFARGRKGKLGKTKKAYVYLKKGDTIEFI